MTSLLSSSTLRRLKKANGVPFFGVVSLVLMWGQKGGHGEPPRSKVKAARDSQCTLRRKSPCGFLIVGIPGGRDLARNMPAKS